MEHKGKPSKHGARRAREADDRKAHGRPKSPSTEQRPDRRREPEQASDNTGLPGIQRPPADS
jgi:hypothetical protein